MLGDAVLPGFVGTRPSLQEGSEAHRCKLLLHSKMPAFETPVGLPRPRGPWFTFLVGSARHLCSRAPVNLRGSMLLVVMFSVRASGELRQYTVLPDPGGKGTTVEIPYTFGTHQVAAKQIEGQIELDSKSLDVRSGRLWVSISELKSDDPKRDCHMREALGLDYSHSRFPKEHVCDDQNRLPAKGNDAIVYPRVELRVTGSKALDDPDLLAQGKEVRVLVTGTWTIHGVTRPASVQLTASADPKNPDTLRGRGRQPFVLSDFGIEVKSAGVLLVSSAVRGGATATFDLRLEPARQP